jgi:hypothetical protein
MSNKSARSLLVTDVGDIALKSGSMLRSAAASTWRMSPRRDDGMGHRQRSTFAASWRIGRSDARIKSVRYRQMKFSMIRMYFNSVNEGSKFKMPAANSRALGGSTAIDAEKRLMSDPTNRQTWRQ